MNKEEIYKAERKGRLRRIKALIVKESLQIVRDPSSILISVVLPLLLMFIYGFGVSLDVNNLKIGMLLEDRSSDALSFAESLFGSTYFDTHVYPNREQLNEDIVRGNIRGYVVIPAYFTQFLKQSDKIAPIQVIADGSETNTANFVQNYINLAWQNWINQRFAEKEIEVPPLIGTQARYWFNEELESHYFLLPGSLAIIMTLIGTMLTALVIAREWELGTMESLMSTPINKMEIIIGKIVPYYVLGMLSMALCVFISVEFYEIPYRGSYFLLAVVSSIFLVSALGFGLLISTVARNQLVAAQIAITVAFLPGFMLSGFIFEISSMPIGIQYLTYLIPTKYFVSMLQTMFLAGDIKSLIIYNSVCLIICSIILYTFTLRRFVKRLD
jgi:ABC-2 type transport system permease protein